MTDRKVLCTTDDGGTMEVEPGAVWLRTGSAVLGRVAFKLEGEALRWMLQACLEALGETGVVLGKKGG